MPAYLSIHPPLLTQVDYSLTIPKLFREKKIGVHIWLTLHTLHIAILDLLVMSPVKAKFLLVVSQNKHLFDDILWKSLIEKYMCGFWCWLAQHESSEGQNFTSMWHKTPLICWYPLNEPCWYLYMWLLVLTCSKRFQRGPKLH